jgi:hypothetical protein
VVWAARCLPIKAVALGEIARPGPGVRRDQAPVGVGQWPAEMPLEMIRERVLAPRWIILVPVSACWRLLVMAISRTRPTSPRRAGCRMGSGDRRAGLHLGHDRAVAAAVGAGDEVVDAALALGVAGVQFCTVGCLISASPSAPPPRLRLVLVAHRGGAAR